MNNTAFVEDWNSVIPFKINAAALEKPTEQFVYKAALNFFKLMHYDVSGYESMYNESIDALTIKRVEFVARINYFYQLCSDSKQTSFFYVDFVKPSAKKIIHLLKIFLNYLFYINMVKETVLGTANSCTEKYFELNAKLNQEQIAEEEIKIRAKNINRHIDDLKNQLPSLVQQIESLEQRKGVIEEKLSTTQANDQDLADKIIELKIEYSKLTERIVADNEAVNLKNTNDALQREIELLSDAQNKQIEISEIHVASINEIRPCITLLEKILQLGFDDSCINIRSELAKLNVSYDKTKIQYNSALDISNTVNKSCIELEAFIEEKEREIAVRQAVLNKRIRKNDGKFECEEKYITALKEINSILDETVVTQQREVQIIVDIAAESLEVIKQSYIE